jgi:Mce-associated membrane protein
MPSPERLLDAPAVELGADAAVAQAMAAAADAQDRARDARARAIRLSGQAEAAESKGEVDQNRPAARLLGRLRALRRPRRRTVAVAGAIVVACAGLGASAYVVWHHRGVTAEHRRTAEYAAAARQGAITYMSINADKARQDVQRIIDDSTGSLKARMLMTAEDLTKTIEKSKVSTTVDVKAVSVDSTTPSSAVVLVVANASATGPGKEKPVSHSWRIVMTLQRDGGQIKMANVEMVP